MKQTERVKDGGMERPVPGAGNTGGKTEDLKELDNQALEDPKLLNSVEDRLKNLGEMTRGSRNNPAAESEEEGDAETPESEETPTPEEKNKESPVKEGEEKELPEAFLRAALHTGWKREDAIEFFNRDPERALVTFSNIHQSVNNLSADYAAMGRREKEKPAEQPVFKPVDTSKLKEQYGDDAAPLIEMIEVQNKAIQQVLDSKPQPKRDQAFQSAAEENSVNQQVDGYFESDPMKPWEKVYGKLEFGQTWDDLPAGAQEHRYRLLTIADQIIGGAHMQRKEMPLKQALEMAHLLVTQKYRDQVLVDGIKAKVVQRSQSLTIKPSKGTKKPGTETDKPGMRTKEQLLATTQQKLNKLYGG